MATQRRSKPPKFWKKAKPKVCTYTFLIVHRSDWPDKVTQTTVRAMAKRIIKSADPRKVFKATWFFDVPKEPNTKIFRLDTKNNTLSLCVTIQNDGTLRFPSSGPSCIPWK